MRAPISVIIPTLNAAEALPACLGALGEGLAEGLVRELIVSDGGSTDETLEIAAGAGAEIVTGVPSRGGQLRRGVAQARGDWVLLLHADTLLEEGWTGPVKAALTRPAAYHFRLAFDHPGLPAMLVAGWANLRSKLFKLPYGDQALLVPRDLLAKCGGVPDMPLMEDVALARALRSDLRQLSACAVTSAAKYRQQGWLRRGGRNLRTLLRYLAGTNPEKLAREYRKP
jgi:rSAM/selenodomain-associated transferase 2